MLADPTRMEAEFKKRLRSGDKHEGPSEVQQIRYAIHGLKRTIARLIDAYGDGLLGKDEFESRIRSLKNRQARLGEELRVKTDEQNQQNELRLVMSRLEGFARKVENNLESSDWATRREIVRTLVKRIEVDSA